MTSLSYSGSWTNDQYVGTTVDPTGLSFTVTKIDGTTESVSPQAHTPTTWGETAGTQTCTFTYTDGYDSVSCEVTATVLPVFTGISVSGTPATQRANAAIDTTGLTVYADYSDGSHVDVTSSADFETDDGNSTWGDCVVYDSTSEDWIYSGVNRKLVASYIGPDDEEYTADSSTFFLEGEVASGTSFELTIGINDWKSISSPLLQEPVVDPWDGATGGYLIEGATAGTNVYMVFTKDQYDNDTPVKLEVEDPPAGNSLQEAMALLDPELEVNSSQPGLWQFYSGSPALLHVMTLGIKGDGTANSEFVMVIGTLANPVTALGTIKKSDFASGYSYYNLKIVESAP